jgi:hypothetical protein
VITFGSDRKPMLSTVTSTSEKGRDAVERTPAVAFLFTSSLYGPVPGSSVHADSSAVTTIANSGELSRFNMPTHPAETSDGRRKSQIQAQTHGQI